MKRDTLEDAVGLVDEVEHAFVATADADGLPHLAAAGAVSIGGADRVGVTEWFCPGTMANLEASRQIALVIWDPETDRGYQLLGQVTEIEDRAVIDGYVPEAGEGTSPQVERELVIRVDEILHFSQGAHSDEPE
jgi:hypothetical protein